jgi:hypothetical protein
MRTWEQVVAFAVGLPEVEESTWYRTPALKVAGKGFARLRDDAEGGLVLMCGLDEKAALLASGDPAFYTTTDTARSSSTSAGPIRRSSRNSSRRRGG